MSWRHVTIGRLDICNFKRFRGQHTIELGPDSAGGRPIVLIGGDNGRGKTSLHEAINYALYEDDDLPGIATRPTYLKAVSDRLNRRALDEGTGEYYVGLTILASDGTAERIFRIQRHWDVNVAERRALGSRLTISENGRRVDWIEDSPSARQDFVRSILPPRIAPFFFFDGERIQQFAEESEESRGMVEAIEDILHINVYKQLRDDLKHYVVDHLEKHEIRSADRDDFFKLQEDAERIESELDVKRNRQADVTREIERYRGERKRAEDELRRIASPHASQRDDLLSDRARIEKELDDAKADVQRGFEPLPLLLARQLLRELQETLQREQRSLTTPDALQELRAKMDAIEHRVFTSPQPSPPPDLLLS